MTLRVWQGVYVTVQEWLYAEGEGNISTLTLPLKHTVPAEKRGDQTLLLVFAAGQVIHHFQL